MTSSFDLQFESDEDVKHGPANRSVNSTSSPAVATTQSGQTISRGKSKSASARPIQVTELSPEDRIIIDMKREHRTDREVADHLRDEGLVNYVSKTIGTRWNRLRTRLAEHQDEQLDSGEAEWTSRQDMCLVDAVAHAKAQVTKLTAAAEAKLWHLVARESRRLDRDSLFSTRACQERYHSISGGSVARYPELRKSEVQEKLEEARRNLAAAMEALKVAEYEADKELRTVLELYHSNGGISSAAMVSLPRTIAHQTSCSVGVAVESGPDPHLTVLPNWMTITTQQENDIRTVHERLKSNTLPPIASMTRAAIANELRTRGFQNAGKVAYLRTILGKARNGDMDMPKSRLPMVEIPTLETSFGTKIGPLGSAEEIVPDKQVAETSSNESSERPTTGQVKGQNMAGKGSKLKRQASSVEHDREDEDKEQEEQSSPARPVEISKRKSTPAATAIATNATTTMAQTKKRRMK